MTLSSGPEDAAHRLQLLLSKADCRPHTAVILGSGLHRIASEAVQAGAHTVSYEEVPGMPVTRVPGHKGQFVLGGHLDGVILQQGRSHYYEGWTVEEITFSVRMLACLGVRRLIVTNAAGGIADGMRPGHLMIITDHLSFVDVTRCGRADRPAVSSAANPPDVDSSTGKLTVRRGQSVWSPRLRQIADRTPTPLTRHHGCYAMMPGPNYETPAEVRMLKSLGVDAVGMSTVPESLTASRLGMEVLGVSCITNAAAGMSDAPLNHQEVSDTAAQVEAEFSDWLQRVIPALPE